VRRGRPDQEEITAAETLPITAWSKTGAAILGRPINPEDASLNTEAARGIL
jgi:hypothetical protein